MRRAAVMPSITGIWMSMITRSKPPRLHRRQRLGAVADHVRAVAGHGQVGREDLPVGRVVLGDQDPRRRHRAGVGMPALRHRPPPSPGARRRRRHPEAEGAAEPRHALDRDLAAHQLDQLPRDGEAEAGAAALAGDGAVDLGEALEERAAWPPPGCRSRCRAPRPRAGRRRRARSRARTSTLPASVNLTALPTRFISTCRSRARVADAGPRGTSGAIVDRRPRRRAAAAGRHQRDHVAGQPVHVRRRRARG